MLTSAGIFATEYIIIITSKTGMSKLFHKGLVWLQVFFSTKQQHTRPDSFNQLTFNWPSSESWIIISWHSIDNFSDLFLAKIGAYSYIHICISVLMSLCTLGIMSTCTFLNCQSVRLDQWIAFQNVVPTLPTKQLDIKGASWSDKDRWSYSSKKWIIIIDRADAVVSLNCRPLLVLYYEWTT